MKIKQIHILVVAVKQRKSNGMKKKEVIKRSEKNYVCSGFGKKGM
jgi:hypothetical protein